MNLLVSKFLFTLSLIPSETKQKVFLTAWVLLIAFFSGNVERQAFLFQSNQNYLEYWLYYTLVILMWLLVIPILTKHNSDYLAVIGLAFVFQMVEDWSYWFFSGYLLPQWFPPLGKLSLIDFPFLNFPFFYYIDMVMAVFFLGLWFYHKRLADVLVLSDPFLDKITLQE